MFDYGASRNAAEFARFREIALQAFQFPEASWPRYVERMGEENFRFLRRDDQVVAGLGFYPMGQYFGGRVVPMAGVAVVAVPPEERGYGVGLELMRRNTEELARSGYAIATLFPATQTLYRKVGYQQAGYRTSYEMPIARLGKMPRPLAARPLASSHQGELHAPYESAARRANGFLARTPQIWSRMLEPRDGNAQTYVVGSPIEGYVCLHTLSGEKEAAIEARELVANSAAALTSLWALIADHRAQITTVRWQGAANDALQSLFLEPRPDTTPLSWERWMVRILDLPAALIARGYPDEIEQELTIEVTDDLLPANNGRFHLRLAEGTMQVERGSIATAGLKMDVRGLVPLYTSLFDARTLAMLGWIEGDERALRAADRIFSGPEPWMADGF